MPSQNTYDSTGTGIVLFQDTMVKDNTLPCSPGEGVNGSLDILSVSARNHAGLDSAAVVSGFRLIVLGEDIASPDMLDDGSGVLPDDGIKANDTTATNATLISSINGFSIDGCVFEPLVILPVKWRDFSVTEKNNEAIIHWSTETEINNDYFDVEWSTDGRDYVDIEKVSASENVQGINEYNTIHKNPLNGVNYYRIKQVDLDGQFSYSDIQSINITDDRKVTFSPNPVSGVLHVLSFETNEKLLTTIYSATGRVVFQDFSTSRELDLSSLNSGIYRISFMIGEHSEAYNLIKI